MPPGPDVGEIVDGTLPGAAGDPRLPAVPPGDRRARTRSSPTSTAAAGCSAAPRSDDPLCRDLCVNSARSSCRSTTATPPRPGSRPPPTTGSPRRPGSRTHAEALGGIAGPLAVAGWSAGANVAAVAAQQAKLAGGPTIAGQVLLSPVTDGTTDRPSHAENAEGYVLTMAVMNWFWDHYCDPADRSDPKASPLLGDLAGLPPAVVFTCEFDPLRDEGDAYAEALAAAGVEVEHLRCPGQTHTAVPAVDAMVTSEYARAAMADALRTFADAAVSA